jgi:RNA polymerase sigma-70 factor (ECF subfamily)
LTKNPRAAQDALPCRFLARPEDEREVFELIGIQGLTQAEVAKVLEVSVMTVNRRLNKARLQLAERLADLRPPTPPGDTPPT